MRQSRIMTSIIDVNFLKFFASDLSRLRQDPHPGVIISDISGRARLSRQDRQGMHAAARMDTQKRKRRGMPLR